MADFIIIVIIVSAAVLIVRGQLRKIRRGQCCGGCSGCSGCSCGCQGGCTDHQKK